VNAETVNDILGYLSTGALAGLGVLALWFWFRRRDRPSLWAALCFGSLAAVAVAGFVVPEDPRSAVERFEQHLQIGVIVLFPYFLYRFAAAFHSPDRRVEIIASGATAALIVWTFLLPELPAEGEPRSLGINLFIAALLADWAGLSLLVAAKLWRAGRGQPSVPRRRMRLLSFAAAALTVTLLIAVANDGQQPVLDAISSVLVIVSTLAFALGLSPPAILRLQWRRPELEKVRDATSGLIVATTPEQVTTEVLPPMAEVVGARVVFLLDAEGQVIGSYGAPAAALQSFLEDERGLATLELRGGGRLIVQAGAYSPFFGAEEMELLRSLGALTTLALDRSRLYVREREVREALERTDELKTNFIALAAHELRTPVTSVHGVVSTIDRLGDRLSDQDRGELDDALRSQSERLRRLVEQLLDLSRLDADSVPIHPVPLPVRDHVEDLVEASVGRSRDQVEIEVPRDLTASVDHTVFERVVSNLLTNALRHGSPPIRVTAERRDRHFRVAVEDRGNGVPPEFVRDLFERFSRSEDARARGLGSGLGLSIARSYARAHGGDLVYEDARPHGARFEFVVPQDGVSEGQG
jgi:signal transduction histidine kinase